MLGSEVTRHYRVAARNSYGPGALSNTDSATTADIAGPEVQSAAVGAQGARIEITFDEPLASAPASRAPASAFTVTADGVAMSLSGTKVAQGTGSDGDRVDLAIGPVRIRQGQSVVVGYEDPSANDDALAIQDDDDNDAPPFTTGANDVPAVDNGSTLTPTAPGKVPGLEAVSGDEGTRIVLTWERPADNGGRVIEDYRIDVSSDGSRFAELVGAHDERLDGAIVLRHEHTVPVGATRHYRVRARSAAGAGAWSNTAVGAAVHPGAPDPPTGLSATARPRLRSPGRSPQTKATRASRANASSGRRTATRHGTVLESRTPTRTRRDLRRRPPSTRRPPGTTGCRAINDDGTGDSPRRRAHGGTTDDIAGAQARLGERCRCRAATRIVLIVFDEALDETDTAPASCRSRRARARRPSR